jgi:hypothetical protein
MAAVSIALALVFILVPIVIGGPNCHPRVAA